MRRALLMVLASAALLGAHAGPDPAESAGASADPVGRVECTAQAASLPGVSLTTVTLVPEGRAPSSGLTPNGRSDAIPVLPSHCLVEGKFEERIGADGKSYAIGFQMRVPLQWNGRLLYQGGGGLNGFIGPAIGAGATNATTAKSALARGFAVVSTDSGHKGGDASFAVDQLAKLNFAYAAIGKVAIVAKSILRHISGREPERTYFMGCSNGGREGMLAAQRFPEQFDGVVAANPAFHISRAVLLAHYSTGVYAAGAPKDAHGAPVLPGVLSIAEGKLLTDRVLRRCDALDGATDGMIFNHAACRFDPVELQCKPGEDKGCLSAAKVNMIRAAFLGPLGSGGAPIVSSWTYDAGVFTDGWRAWQIGSTNPDGRSNLTLPGLVNETLGRYLQFPMMPVGTLSLVDVPTALENMAPAAALTDASATQMSTFAAKGGKLLLVTGWSDPIFAPEDLIEWYRTLDHDMSSLNVPATKFARLFMVPGMTHCGGGPALDDFDALTTLMAWVEKKKAPDRMIATGSYFPGVSRPICAYPSIATYRSGARKTASSYACTVPAIQ